jgi:hypothetical protein
MTSFNVCCNILYRRVKTHRYLQSHTQDETQIQIKILLSTWISLQHQDDTSISYWKDTSFSYCKDTSARIKIRIGTRLRNRWTFSPFCENKNRILIKSTGTLDIFILPFLWIFLQLYLKSSFDMTACSRMVHHCHQVRCITLSPSPVTKKRNH